jgi:hypothetical protein
MSGILPRIPKTGAELNRAVYLLNCCLESMLGREERAEIKELVGIYPTPAQAIAWKQAFKRVIARRIMLG